MKTNGWTRSNVNPGEWMHHHSAILTHRMWIMENEEGIFIMRNSGKDDLVVKSDPFPTLDEAQQAALIQARLKG